MTLLLKYCQQPYYAVLFLGVYNYNSIKQMSSWLKLSKQDLIPGGIYFLIREKSVQLSSGESGGGGQGDKQKTDFWWFLSFFCSS